MSNDLSLIGFQQLNGNSDFYEFTANFKGKDRRIAVQRKLVESNGKLDMNLVLDEFKIAYR